MIFLGISKNFNFSEMSYYTTNKKFLQAGALHHAAESLSLLKKCGFLNFSVISQVFFDLTDTNAEKTTFVMRAYCTGLQKVLQAL